MSNLLARIVTVALLLVPSAALGGVSADFDDGNTSAAADGYPGMAGGGWAGAWSAPTDGASWTTGPTVTSTTPLSPGGGNYLTATLTESSGNRQATVARQFDNGAVSYAAPHKVRFQFRPEDLNGFTHNDDRFFLFDRTSPRAGTDASVSWMILAAGDTRGDTNWNAGEWFVFDGHKNGGGFYVNQYVNSGIPLSAGTTYDMEVTVYPDAKEWDVTISDGSSTWSQTDLGFRINSAQAGGTLNFGGRANDQSPDDTRSFSLDAVEVAPFEPASIEANFNRGEGSIYVDQFQGAPGKGWQGGWADQGSGSSTVETAAPLNGPGDPYLAVTNTGTGDRTVVRGFEQYGLIDPADPYRVQWKWRFDGDPADVNEFGDRIHFYADDSAENGTNSGNSWIVGLVGADRAGNDIHDGHWYFYDRTDPNDGFTGDNMVDTGLSLLAGQVYDFEVLVYPADGTYDATIFDGTTTFAAEDLVFRNGSTGQFNFLHFGGFVSDPGEDWAFSLDSVRVSLIPEAPGIIPEPSTLLVWSLLAGLGVGVGWRRRKR